MLADRAFDLLSNQGNRIFITETLETHFRVICLLDESRQPEALLLLLMAGESGELFALLRTL